MCVDMRGTPRHTSHTVKMLIKVPIKLQDKPGDCIVDRTRRAFLFVAGSTIGSVSGRSSMPVQPAVSWPFPSCRFLAPGHYRGSWSIFDARLHRIPWMVVSKSSRLALRTTHCPDEAVQVWSLTALMLLDLEAGAGG